MKEFLSRGEHAFTVRNVDDDNKAYRALMALGVMSVPVTVIGDVLVKGFNAKALTEALNALAQS